VDLKQLLPMLSQTKQGPLLPSPQVKNKPVQLLLDYQVLGPRQEVTVKSLPRARARTLKRKRPPQLRQKSAKKRRKRKS
jgi:hypothetical protein